MLNNKWNLVLLNNISYLYTLRRVAITPREGTPSIEPALPRPPSLDRRRLPDRRARPMTLWSALRWQGRCHGCRRAWEGRHVYVDCLARRTVALALLVVRGSVLEAVLTLLHLQDGGS